ncbi:unnamed protein product, partial [Heterotrigona itama]
RKIDMKWLKSFSFYKKFLDTLCLINTCKNVRKLLLLTDYH